jgi:cytochrome d ubiquinol oxidase subunit I
MISIGMMFIVSTLYASYLRFRDRLFEKRWLLWYFVFAVLFAFAANEAGWVTAEVGRQPWIVYPTLHDGQLGGGLRTSHALSEAVTAEQVLGSIIMFGVIYLFLFVLWVMLLNGKIQKGPEPVDPADRPPPRSLFDAAARRVDHEASLTESKS